MKTTDSLQVQRGPIRDSPRRRVSPSSWSMAGGVGTELASLRNQIASGVFESVWSLVQTEDFNYLKTTVGMNPA